MWNIYIVRSIVITILYFFSTYSYILRLGHWRRRRRRCETQVLLDDQQRTIARTDMSGYVRRNVHYDRGSPDAQYERPFPADPRRIPLSRPR